MKQQIILSIPKPCHENWNNMTAVEKGRFCDSCQKKVFDFTADSDRNIIEKITSEENVCGRFLVTQLDRPLLQPASKYPRYLAVITSLLGLFQTGGTKAVAQMGDTVVVEMTKGEVMGKMIARPTNKVSGIVTANGKPVKGVKVSVDGDIIHAVTDENGAFTVKFHKGATLIFMHDEFKQREVTLSEQPLENLKVELEDKNQKIYILGGLGVTGVMIHRPSRMRRLKDKIKSWFN